MLKWTAEKKNINWTVYTRFLLHIKKRANEKKKVGKI